MLGTRLPCASERRREEDETIQWLSFDGSSWKERLERREAASDWLRPVCSAQGPADTSDAPSAEARERKTIRAASFLRMC